MVGIGVYAKRGCARGIWRAVNHFPMSDLTVLDLGRMPYAAAYQRQLEAWGRVVAAREAGSPVRGEVLLVEHDPPVVTVSQRPTARKHLVATDAMLARAGVVVETTDRGGDITYHGPGQLVVYPILDLNHLHLRLHDYMRRLEDVVIATLGHFGVAGLREPGATGVWVKSAGSDTTAKICAMGIRVRQWISLHGLALNVTTDLSHFDLIVPCGLAGRRVTSLRELLGGKCPAMSEVKSVLIEELANAVE
jgi:lipoyl(octanoyl) transferase